MDVKHCVICSAYTYNMHTFCRRWAQSLNLCLSKSEFHEIDRFSMHFKSIGSSEQTYICRVSRAPILKHASWWDGEETRRGFVTHSILLVGLHIT